MRYRVITIGFVGCMAIGSGLASGEPQAPPSSKTLDSPPTPASVRAAVLHEFVYRAALDPSRSLPGSAPDSGINITAASTDSSASIEFARQLSLHALSVTLSTPISGKEDAVLTSLGGVNGTRARFAWSYGWAAGSIKSKSLDFQSLVEDFKQSRGNSRRPDALVSFETTATRDEFAFRAADFGKTQQTHLSYSVSGTAGLAFNADDDSGTYVGGTYGWDSTWKPADEIDLCQPSNSIAGVLTCEKAIMSGPTKKGHLEYGIQLRRQFLADLAVAFRATYRGKEDRWLFELPIYLIPKKTEDGDKTELTGGLKIGWTKAQGDYFAIFVGPSFSVRGKPDKLSKRELERLRNSK